jgi:site-specific recombinase XerD
MRVNELFETYLKYLAQKGYAARTIREYKRFLYGPLAKAIGDREITSLTITDCAKLIEAGKNYGEFGPQRAVVTFRRLMCFVHECGQPTPFDYRDLPVPKVPGKENEYLTEEEMEIVMNALDVTTHAGLRTRALLEVLYASGMRVSEAISLNRDDIDFELKEAWVTNAKSKDREKVYFNDRSLEWVKRYLEFRKDDMPALFVSGRGRMLSCTSRNYMRVHLSNLGIKKHLKHHIFRKTFVTHLIQQGADISSVQDLARHRSPRTTLKSYAVINKERSKEVHQKILNKPDDGPKLIVPGDMSWLDGEYAKTTLLPPPKQS